MADTSSDTPVPDPEVAPEAEAQVEPEAPPAPLLELRALRRSVRLPLDRDEVDAMLVELRAG